jgi:hypothetical protein
MHLILLPDFIQGKEAFYQGLIFFYAYSIFYNLFIARTEIKS